MGVVLFELNEVPWRVMDWFCDRNPRSALARMRNAGRHFETHTEDKGTLHPWVTWPGVHRGVDNTRHGIAHLGQDIGDVDKAFPTLWSYLSARGVSVGVAGSLQSYPLPGTKDNIRFYIPDTYAPTADTIPLSLSSFQDVNLRLTKENSRNVAGRTSVNAALQLTRALPQIGISMRTVTDIGRQLMRERTDKTKLNRRRAIQSQLYFDAFMKQLRTQKPGFSTFFTNHVAATMHRFWAATFPEDYEKFDLPDDWVDSYRDEIEWAMGLADEFVGRLMRFCENNRDYSIVLCSSMGQSATTARLRDGIFTLRNLERFFAVIGVEAADYRPAMAMAPDISVHLLTDNAVERCRAALKDMHKTIANLDWDIDDRGLMHVRLVIRRNPEMPLPEIMIGNRLLDYETLGIAFLEDQDRVATTAYHVPNGVQMSWSPMSEADKNWRRPGVSNLEVAPAIISAFGVELPPYMKRTRVTL